MDRGASSCLPEPCTEGLWSFQERKDFVSDQEKMSAFHSVHTRTAGLEHTVVSGVSWLLLPSSSPTRKVREIAKDETADRDIFCVSPFLGQPAPFLQY